VGVGGQSPVATRYRPEVDGLRAVAVVGVIVYHAMFGLPGGTAMPGGFLGVDVFFVISGYLITRLILAECASTAGFRLVHFYERRARRILPMLFVVLLATLPAAWSWLLPGDFVDYSHSALAAALFVSNFHFWQQAVEYASESALLEPLLHTWSLGIEEQYYFLFPLLALLTYRFARHRLVAVFGALLLPCLVLAIVLAGRAPEFNFHFPLSRFWEMLAGSVVAALELRGFRVRSGRLRQALPLFGLVLIGASFVVIDDGMAHPGWPTLAPVLGTALIIAASDGRDPAGRLLASPIPVAVGLVSYSAYLWHFPLLAFARIAGGEPAPAVKLALIALTFVLSALSWRLVERPFRNRRQVSRKTLAIALAAAFCAVAALHTAVIQNRGFEQRLPEIFRSEDFSQEPWRTLVDENGKPCFDGGLCRFEGEDPDAPSIYFIGDSHLAALGKNLRERLVDHDLYFDLVGGCPVYLDATRYTSDGRTSTCTAAVQRRRLDQLLEVDPDIVVSLGRYPLFFEERWFDNGEGGVESDDHIVIRSSQGIGKAEAVRRGLRALLGDKRHVVLVYPLVEAGWNIPDRLSRLRPADPLDWKDWLRDNPVTISAVRYRQRTASSFEALDSVVHPRLHRVYPHELFCDTEIPGRCVTHDLERLYYADDDHPSARGAEIINGRIIEAIRRIGAQSGMQHDTG